MNNKSPRPELTKLLTEAREKKHLTQQDVAEAIGMKEKNYYARIERGEINVSYDKLKKIAEVLDLELLKSN